MTDLEALVIEMGAGVKLLTGMLGLPVALLPEVLKALTALRAEAELPSNTEHSHIAAKSSVEAGRALTVMIEKFAAEIAASRQTGVP